MLCLWVFYLHVCLCITWRWCPCRPKENIIHPLNRSSRWKLATIWRVEIKPWWTAEPSSSSMPIFIGSSLCHYPRFPWSPIVHFVFLSSFLNSQPACSPPCNPLHILILCSFPSIQSSEQVFSTSTDYWHVRPSRSLMTLQAWWWVTTALFPLAVIYSAELYLRYTQIFCSSFTWFTEQEPHKAIDTSWGKCPGTTVVDNLVYDFFAQVAYLYSLGLFGLDSGCIISIFSYIVAESTFMSLTGSHPY